MHPLKNFHPNATTLSAWTKPITIELHIPPSVFPKPSSLLSIPPFYVFYPHFMAYLNQQGPIVKIIPFSPVESLYTPNKILTPPPLVPINPLYPQKLINDNPLTPGSPPGTPGGTDHIPPGQVPATTSLKHHSTLSRPHVPPLNLQQI